MAELTKEELKQVEELQQKVEAQCQSPEDVEKLFKSDLLPKGDELSEEALGLVAGGMSVPQGLKIISTAYWDLCVRKKSKTSYSNRQIEEAFNVVEKASKTATIIAWKIALRKLGIPV